MFWLLSCVTTCVGKVFSEIVSNKWSEYLRDQNFEKFPWSEKIWDVSSLLIFLLSEVTRRNICKSSLSCRLIFSFTNGPCFDRPSSSDKDDDRVVWPQAFVLSKYLEVLERHASSQRVLSLRGASSSCAARRPVRRSPTPHFRNVFCWSIYSHPVHILIHLRHSSVAFFVFMLLPFFLNLN